MGDEGDKFGRGIEMEVKAKKEIWSLLESERTQGREQRREDLIHGH